MRRTDRRHLLLTDHWYQPLIVQRHNQVRCQTPDNVGREVWGTLPLQGKPLAKH